MRLPPMAQQLEFLDPVGGLPLTPPSPKDRQPMCADTDVKFLGSRMSLIHYGSCILPWAVSCGQIM